VRDLIPLSTVERFTLNPDAPADAFPEGTVALGFVWAPEDPVPYPEAYTWDGRTIELIDFGGTRDGREAALELYLEEQGWESF
jgi:hypothetical protein